MNIAHQFERAARLFPDRTAIEFEGEIITYAMLHSKAASLAAALRNGGVVPGDRIALFLPNIPAFAIVYFAVQKIGAIAVSINARSTEVENRYVLNDCSAKLVFTTQTMRSNVPNDVKGIQQIIICEGDAIGDVSFDAFIQQTTAVEHGLQVDQGAPAVILYTSGTTGTPKGATLSIGNVISNSWSFVHNCGIGREDRILLPLPLFHCFGQNALMNSALMVGATLVLHRAFRPDLALKALEQERITMFFAVPTMFLALLDKATPEQLQSVRYYFSAAAKLPEEIERRWHEKFGRVITQGYGLTETSPFASYNSFISYRAGSIGTPIENVEMKVIDVYTGEDVAPGELGEIVIKGPNVMIGYWNKQQETEQVLRHGWFRSGDIGRMDYDGYFYIADRLKDMIDVGGMNVYPVEIENVLYKHPAVAEAAVYGIPDALMGEQVRATVVVRTGTILQPDDLIAFCKAQLADFKTPRVVELADELPKNPAGKILKRVLKAQAAERLVANELALEYHQRSKEDGQTLLRDFVMAELSRLVDLPAEQMDDTDALTELGLESLMAVDLATMIRARLGIDFSATDLVSGSTVQSVVASLEKLLARQKKT
jgi:long-chain acyl-CoA synthetase